MWNLQKNVFMCIKKYVLVNEILSSIGLPQAWVEKAVHGMKTHWLSGKEKVLGAAVSKEGDGIWKNPVLLIFLKKVQL